MFKISAIGARSISKLFTEYTSIDNYYQTYQKIYKEIISQLTNKNRYK